MLKATAFQIEPGETFNGKIVDSWNVVTTTPIYEGFGESFYIARILYKDGTHEYVELYQR